VQDGRNGFVVPERNPPALADAIQRLAVKPGLAARLGDQARRDVERFSHSAMADAFEAAIEHAVAAAAARRRRLSP
jgi:glycosyltransferase involved in cell wall biosynthesis